MGHSAAGHFHAIVVSAGNRRTRAALTGSPVGPSENGGFESWQCWQKHLPSPALPSIRWRGGSRILGHDNPGLLSRCSFTLGYNISPLTGLGIGQYRARDAHH